MPEELCQMLLEDFLKNSMPCVKTMVEKLVGYGITSISVNPDSIERARLLIHNAEKKVGKR